MIISGDTAKICSEQSRSGLVPTTQFQTTKKHEKARNFKGVVALADEPSLAKSLWGKFGCTALRPRRHGAPPAPAALASRFAFIGRDLLSSYLFSTIDRAKTEYSRAGSSVKATIFNNFRAF